MGLIDALRKHDGENRNAAQRRLDQARETWDEAVRRLRRKMRLHPKPEPQETAEPMNPPVSSSGAVAQQSLSHRASEEDAA